MSPQVEWFALSEAEKDRMYPHAIRQTFGMGTLPNATVETVFLPPMRSLEFAQIEITTWCNFKCQQCSRTREMAAGTWTNRHITIEDYKTIISKLPPAWKVVLQGVGEPTLHPNFGELVRIAHETGKFGAISFNTNGHSHNDEFWRNLAANNRCIVSLSIDSLDPATAAICREGTDVAQLKHQLRLFREIFSDFSVTMVASKLNLRDIPLTLRQLAELGITTSIHGVVTRDEGIALEPEDYRWLAEQVTGLRREFPAFQVAGADGSSNGISTGLVRCVAPFVAPFVTVDGKLAPCCAGIDPAQYKQTSLLDERSWDEIRASEPVTGWFRRYLVEDPPMCRGCSLNPQRVELVAKSRPASRNSAVS